MSSRPISLLLTALLSACGATATEDAAPPTSALGVPTADAIASGWIRTESGRDLPAPTRVDAPGRVVVAADADARVSLPGAGRVQQVLVREGTPVTRGTPLLRIGSADAARARADVATTTSTLRAAEAELARQERLAASGVGLHVEQLRAEADVHAARAAATAARSAADLFGPGSGDTVTLSAPIDGVVFSVDARPGAVVTADSDALVSIVQTDALHVRLDVFEDELVRVAPGQAVQIDPGNGASAQWGTVTQVANAASPVTRRGSVLVELDERPTDWVPGRHVRGRINAAAVGNIAVPASAVVIRPDRTRVVYVDDGGALVARRVEVGRVVDGLVPILTGLSVDELVVVEGALLVDALADRLL